MNKSNPPPKKNNPQTETAFWQQRYILFRSTYTQAA